MPNLYLPIEVAQNCKDLLQQEGITVVINPPLTPERRRELEERFQIEIPPPDPEGFSYRCTRSAGTVDLQLELDRKSRRYVATIFPVRQAPRRQSDDLELEIVRLLEEHGARCIDIGSGPLARLQMPAIGITRSLDLVSFQYRKEICSLPLRLAWRGHYVGLELIDISGRTLHVQQVELVQPRTFLGKVFCWLTNGNAWTRVVEATEGDQLTLDQIKARIIDTIRRRDEAQWVPRWRTEALVKLVNCCDSFEELVELTTWL
ncbi:hypothetical protein [Thermostilla marina]